MFGFGKKKNDIGKRLVALRALQAIGGVNTELSEELFEALKQGQTELASIIWDLGTRFGEHEVSSLKSCKPYADSSSYWKVRANVLYSFGFFEHGESKKEKAWSILQRHDAPLLKPLAYFILTRNETAVKFLLERGLNPNDGSGLGKNFNPKPVVVATESALRLNKPQLLKLCLDHGGSIQLARNAMTVVIAVDEESSLLTEAISAVLELLQSYKQAEVPSVQEPKKVSAADEVVNAQPLSDEIIIESQLAGQPRKEVYSFTRMERVTFFGKDVPPLRETFNHLGRRDEGLKAAIALHNQRGGEHTIDSMFGRHIEKPPHFIKRGD